MTDIFRVDFYPKDWLVKTTMLSPEERGVYIQIIALIYSYGGPIHNDPKHIAGVSGCSTRKAKIIIDELVSRGFLQFSGEKITQKRAEKELEIKFSLIKNGRKGGEKKAENNKNNNLGSSPISRSRSNPSPNPISKVLEEVEFLKPDVFDQFIEHRKSLGKPIHKNFIPKVIDDLKKIVAQGDDPNLVIEQSIKNGWSSLQPLVNQKGKNKNEKKSRKQDLAEQAAKLMDKIGASGDRQGHDSLL